MPRLRLFKRLTGEASAVWPNGPSHAKSAMPWPGATTWTVSALGTSSYQASALESDCLMPAVTTIAPTGDTYIDGLLGDLKWAVNSFTYSFPTSGSLYGTSYGEGENVTGFAALSTIQ